jgi:hypothetical protein
MCGGRGGLTGPLTLKTTSRMPNGSVVALAHPVSRWPRARASCAASGNMKLPGAYRGWYRAGRLVPAPTIGSRQTFLNER